MSQAGWLAELAWFAGISACLLGTNYMRRAGSVCQDLGTSVKHTKIQPRNYMEKSQPGQLGPQYCNARIPARRTRLAEPMLPRR